MILTAETHNARRAPAPDVALMHRILLALAGHSSKRPARAADIAAQLGVSEAALVAAEVGLTAIRIDGSANRFLERAPELGTVMALTRNESSVHEKIGPFVKASAGEMSPTMPITALFGP